MGYEERPEQSLLRQFAGMNTADGELGLPVGDSPQLDNVDLHPAGSAQKRKGIAAIASPTGVTKIDAVMRLNQPEQSRGWIYVIGNNNIYRVPEPGTWKWQTPTHASTYTLTSQKVYGRQQSRYNTGSVEHPSVLYLPRANGVPLIALGQTAAASDIITHPTGAYGGGTPGSGTPGSPVTDSAIGSVAWGSNHYPRFMRLVALGRGARMHAWGFADDPSRVDFSEMDVPWNYLRSDVDNPAATAQPEIDGGFYYARRGDGDEVTSVVDMFAYTVVFKRRATLIYTGDPGSEDWLLRAEFPVGCVSDRAWAKVGNDLLFWSEDGPRALSAVQEYGDLAHTQLALKIAEDVTDIVPDSYERICCYHDAKNMRVVWFVAKAGASHNDAAYVYYYTTGRWAQWTGSRCEMMDVAVIKPTSINSERVIGGSYDNGMVVHDSAYADISDDVDAEYITDWIRFGEVSDSTRSLWLDVFYGEGGANVDIYYQTDLTDEWNLLSRVVRSYGNTGTTWGNFTWANAAWGVTGRSHRAWELDAIFRMIRLKFAKSGTGAFEVMGYRLEARKKGARA